MVALDLRIKIPKGVPRLKRAKFLKAASLSMHRKRVEGFQTETAPDGTKWAALRPSTVALRGETGPILRESGGMFETMQASSSRWQARVEIGSKIAGYHQGGTSKMVARPILGFGRDDEAELQRLAMEHFD